MVVSVSPIYSQIFFILLAVAAGVPLGISIKRGELRGAKGKVLVIFLFLVILIAVRGYLASSI